MKLSCLPWGLFRDCNPTRGTFTFEEWVKAAAGIRELDAVDFIDCGSIFYDPDEEPQVYRLHTQLRDSDLKVDTFYCDTFTCLTEFKKRDQELKRLKRFFDWATLFEADLVCVSTNTRKLYRQGIGTSL